MDILTYINKMNRLYGSEPLAASVKPKPGWQHAPWQDYPQDDDIPSVQKRAQLKPGGLVEPGVTHYGTKEKITADQFKKEFDKFQKLKKNIGSDPEFAKYLNKNYTTTHGKPFSSKNVYQHRTRHDIKAVVGQVPPAVMARHQKITALMEDLISKSNLGEK